MSLPIPFTATWAGGASLYPLFACSKFCKELGMQLSCLSIGDVVSVWCVLLFWCLSCTLPGGLTSCLSCSGVFKPC